jgi:hypothetical protein
MLEGGAETQEDTDRLIQDRRKEKRDREDAAEREAEEDLGLGGLSVDDA